MLRICLCLLIAFASAGVAARDVKLSTAGSGECEDTVADKKPARASARVAPSPRETRIKPSVHGDSNAGSRLQSPRWHSFLPGMFR